MDIRAHTPLLEGISQFEVDFVIPRLGVDIPVGIDPFLLFKSKDPELSTLHTSILSVLNQGVRHIRSREFGEAKELLTFPEVPEIGLGYTKRGKRGSGVGAFLSSLVTETLAESPSLLERGVRHIEELQLVSLGIGPDRVSDITANLIKTYLIGYTQRQCMLWSIPITSNVPLAHVFDWKNHMWEDLYVDLPLSRYDQSPILLVPRRIVRTLPWINYADFFRLEFAAYLRAKKIRAHASMGSHEASETATFAKDQVITMNRREVERIERYVRIKEATAADAQPSQAYLNREGLCPEGDSLLGRLSNIPPGKEKAGAYQRLILEMCNYLFNPELIDGRLEVRTFDGTERRDLVFTNDSDRTFWSHLREAHGSFLLMFEAKNVSQLEIEHINQVSTYLGDRLGHVGFIATRGQLSDTLWRKIVAVYNDSHPRKIILTLGDIDFKEMIRLKCAGKDPMRHVQGLYRDFLTSAQ